MLAVLAIAAPSHAQVCLESTTQLMGAPANLLCDMKYRDSLITCDSPNPNDVFGTRPACPAKPMPMISTPQLSYISDYTPYLYIFPKDAKDPTLPYAGKFASGTPGDASRTFQLFGNSAPGTKRIAGCTTQIHAPSDPSDNKEWAQLIRLQIDNCTNQYILQRATEIFQGEMPNRLVTIDDPAAGPKRIDLKSECQPLTMRKATDKDYDPTVYLQAAWTKTMQDPGYRKSTPSQTKCVPCTISNLGSFSPENSQPPCDHEPHLPCSGIGSQGLKLDNTKAPPNPFPDVPLSALDALQYEAILDPTHPFSPRWDYVLNDRDYSNPAARWFGMSGNQFAVAIAAYGLMKTYMSTSDNAVFCAGMKKSKSTDTKKKANDEVRVDVLEFRRNPFEAALGRRVAFNAACYQYKGQFKSGAHGWALPYNGPPVLFTSFCNSITGWSWFYPFLYGRDYDCWDCFGLSGKVDDENQHPPCTTNYVGSDLSIKYIPGAFNGFNSEANCGDSMKKVCADLRKPFAPLNKLKMRYHNPEDKDDPQGKNIVLKGDLIDPTTMKPFKDGALEGFTFREYFGNHMPYPRLWDTGKSLQKTDSGDPQPPLDTTGQFTAIVGVGREAAAKSASDNAPKVDGKSRADIFTDQRCKTMGYGGYAYDLLASAAGRDYRRGFADFAGLKVDWPDPMTSWTEMKLYQTRTERSVGLSCIARYEKVFKPLSTENMMLMKTGAEWQKGYISKCTRGPGGKVTNCTQMSMKQYDEAGNPKADSTTIYIPDLLLDGIPNQWRGYMGTLDLNSKFPVFGSGTPAIVTGLNNAEVGDIVLLPFGPEFGYAALGGDKVGLAKLAMVVETHLPDDGSTTCVGGCYIRVLEPDNGKWPDICGTTDTWGMQISRYYYMPGQLPQEATDEYAKIGLESANCKETKISRCEMNDWDSMNLYRIRYDNRTGCKDDEKASKCK